MTLPPFVVFIVVSAGDAAQIEPRRPGPPPPLRSLPFASLPLQLTFLASLSALAVFDGALRGQASDRKSIPGRNVIGLRRGPMSLINRDAGESGSSQLDGSGPEQVADQTGSLDSKLSRTSNKLGMITVTSNSLCTA